MKVHTQYVLACKGWASSWEIMKGEVGDSRRLQKRSETRFRGKLKIFSGPEGKLNGKKGTWRRIKK